MDDAVVDKNLSDLTSGLGVAEKRIALEKELIDLTAILKKRGGRLFGLSSSMTNGEKVRYKNRIREINTLLIRFGWVQDAIEDGYQLFWPDQDWFVCQYWESSRFGYSEKGLQFRKFTTAIKTPMPECVLDAFNKAEKEPRFDAIVMAVPYSNYGGPRQSGEKNPDLVMLGIIIVDVNAPLNFYAKTVRKDRRKVRVPANFYQGAAIFKLDEWELPQTPITILHNYTQAEE